MRGVSRQLPYVRLRVFVVLWIVFTTTFVVSAQVFVGTPQSCLGATSLTAPVEQQLIFDKVYAQLDQGQKRLGEKAGGLNYSAIPTLYDSNGDVIIGSGGVLRLVLTGTTGASSQGYSNTTTFLSTLVQTSEVLTFDVNSNTSALCSSIRTINGGGGTTTNGSSTVTNSGCPYGPGSVALGVNVPIKSSYPLTTINVNLLMLDPSVPAMHLGCYNLQFSPYYPSFFPYQLIHYLIIGILAVYFALYLLARVWASYTHFVLENETNLATSLTLKISSTDGALSRRQLWGVVWFGAWSGRQVVGSGSLRRFVTAEFRELFATVIWITLVGTIPVRWPTFIYPVFAQTSWTSLVYSKALPFTSSTAPLLSSNSTPSTAFASQFSDPSSPLYLDETLPSVLLDIDSSHDGMQKWAQAIGIRHEDLWSVCAFTFFSICVVVIILHLVALAFDTLLDKFYPSRKQEHQDTTAKGNDMNGDSKEDHSSKGNAKKPSKPQPSRNSNDPMDRYRGEDYDNGLDEQEFYTPTRVGNTSPSWKLHLSLLQGNLTRVLFLFHLPLSVFSVYQISLQEVSPRSTFALAITTFALVCVATPLLLLWLVHVRSVHVLYSFLPMLLSLGPMYNTYSQECSMFIGFRIAANLIIAIVIGGVQKSGTAQAAVILTVEVVDTLVTSLWLPWGDNAAMGPLAFILSISRIIIAVLLVVLSPAVHVSNPAASWLAYIVLLVQALVILLLLFALIFKILELLIRFLGKVPFDESRSSRAGGLFGAIRKWEGTSGRSSKRKASGHGRTQTDGRRRRHHDQDLLQRDRDRGTVTSRTRMLPAEKQRQSYASSLSNLPSSATYNNNGVGRTRHSPSTADDDFIMSAMSSGPWASASPGYVKPGAYSTASGGGPVLRSGPAWHEPVKITPDASPPTAGFARVGGGKSSHSNPYKVTEPSVAYPPYPSSSADMYAVNSSSMPAHVRRQSQSAIIEMAGAAAFANEAVATANRSTARSPANMPSSSALLSNTVAKYSPEILSPAATSPKQSTGFFGRFKKRRNPAHDLSSDDDFSDESEDEQRVKQTSKTGRSWPLRFGGKRFTNQPQGDGMNDEEGDQSTGEVGFVVQRKPRPRPSPQGTDNGTSAGNAGVVQHYTSLSTDTAVEDGLQEGDSVPVPEKP